MKERRGVLLLHLELDLILQKIYETSHYETSY